MENIKEYKEYIKEIEKDILRENLELLKEIENLSNNETIRLISGYIMK